MKGFKDNMNLRKEYPYLTTLYRCPITLTQEELLKYSDDKLHNYIQQAFPNGFQFKDVEQIYQALRTDNIYSFIDILNAANGYTAKVYVRDNEVKARKKWAVYRDNIMEFANIKKFEQHPELAKEIAKIDTVIHNDISYKDYNFGRVITDNNKGLDILGNILNNIRLKYKEIYYPDVKDTKKYKTNKGNFSLKNNLGDDILKYIKNIKDRYFYVIDTETSGKSNKYWDIIELSAIKVNGNTFEIEDEFDIYINPGYKLPQNIIEFNKQNGTGICDELLQEKGYKPKEAVNMFIDFIGDNPIILGQNIIFDIGFINKLYNQQLKRDFCYEDVCDTLKMAKEKIPGKHNLGVLYGLIPNAPELSFHKSIDDVKATLEVFKWLTSFYGIDINTVNKEKDEQINLD
jgi:DNA polymerase III epsilon subunit-like protein/predicted NAD-dependent protein-ADP-ribosyltransferase YbiA (DUF1768 family)